MEVLFILLPLTVFISIVIAVFFLWSVHSGQYDNLDIEAHRVLMDDDETKPAEQ